MPIAFKNNSATPVGLWDTNSIYHVAPPLGGSITLEPDQVSSEVIDVYAAAGDGSVTQLVGPVNTAVPVISGTARVGESLTGTNGTWAGTPTPKYSKQWKADGANISGATSATYTLKTAELGKAITLTVTATNEAGTASATSAATGAVVAALASPVNTAAPAVTGTPEVDSVLTTTNGTWTGNPTPTYARAWQRSADGATGWAAISGATATTYTLTAADDANYVRCAVTGTNSQGSVTATSNAVGPITTADTGE